MLSQLSFCFVVYQKGLNVVAAQAFLDTVERCHQTHKADILCGKGAVNVMDTLAMR